MALTSKTIKKLKELFKDELVVFYLADMSIPLPSEDGEIKVSAMVSGIVLDIDGDFYYVGDPETGQFVRTISHDAARIVEIMSLEQDLLDYDLPANDSEVH